MTTNKELAERLRNLATGDDTHIKEILRLGETLNEAADALDPQIKQKIVFEAAIVEINFTRKTQTKDNKCDIKLIGIRFVNQQARIVNMEIENLNPDFDMHRTQYRVTLEPT